MRMMHACPDGRSSLQCNAMQCNAMQCNAGAGIKRRTLHACPPRHMSRHGRVGIGGVRGGTPLPSASITPERHRPHSRRTIPRAEQADAWSSFFPSDMQSRMTLTTGLEAVEAGVPPPASAMPRATRARASQAASRTLLSLSCRVVS